MVRITNWKIRHKRHKSFTNQTKWFRLWRNNVYKQVRNAIIKQWQNAYIWRRLKKRDFRKLWIERLSAALRSRWGKYSVFVNNMAKKDVALNRKVLSNIAVAFPEVFDKIYEEVSK